MGLFGGLFKKKEGLAANTGQMTMEEIEKIQLSLKDRMDPDTYNSVFNQACRLIPKKQYAQAIALFEAVRENTGDATEKASCDSQIGVCHFFMDEHEKALDDYTRAFRAGHDQQMSDFNIWEVCEILMKKDGNKAKWSQEYLALFPNGEYAAKAKKNL